MQIGAIFISKYFLKESLGIYQIVLLSDVGV